MQRYHRMSGPQELWKKLKNHHILDWIKEERYHCIVVFAYLAIQMKNLMANNEAILIVDKQFTIHVKTGNGPERKAAVGS